MPSQDDLTTMDALAPIELLQPIQALETLEAFDLNLRLTSLPHSAQKSTVSANHSVAASSSSSSSFYSSFSKSSAGSPTDAESGGKRLESPGPASPGPTEDADATLGEATATEQHESARNERPATPIGCYLTFEAVSEGTLFLNWSESPIDGALAFFSPGKAVPKFKFKQNGGKSELIRGMRGGTGKGMKRYFEGWVQFIKLAREFVGEVMVWHSKDVALYYLDASNKVQRLATDRRQASSAACAVAAIAPVNTTFEGVVTMTRDYFAGTGNREGAALLF